MFFKFFLDDTEQNLFHHLSTSTNWETITIGRKGANLVDMKNNFIPLVRTTTSYQNPIQKMLPIHHHLLDQIQKKLPPQIQENKNISFNNALIEIYDHKYHNMGYHSDQALDLNEESFICLYSCYNNPLTKNVRKLRIKEKGTDQCSDIILDHNSVVLFSVHTNSKYWHKIILEPHSFSDDDTYWLGITFRQSKTFIYFKNEIPYFSQTDQPLTLSTPQQQKEFYKNRAMENAHVKFMYPEINYTISMGDLIPVS